MTDISRRDALLALGVSGGLLVRDLDGALATELLGADGAMLAGADLAALGVSSAKARGQTMARKRTMAIEAIISSVFAAFEDWGRRNALTPLAIAWPMSALALPCGVSTPILNVPSSTRGIEVDTAGDPALIGGAVITAGDVVIDGSLRGKLERLQSALAA